MSPALKLKASQSSTQGNNLFGDGILDDKKRKDIMALNLNPNDKALSVAPERGNDKGLDFGPLGDNFSRRSKNKKTRVTSREGSKRGKRGKKGLGSVNSKKDKANRARAMQRRVIHNDRNLVLFNEFKSEDRIHKAIGVNEDKDKNNKSKLESFNIDGESIEMDQSKMNEAISYQYSLADRSYSFDDKDNSIFEKKDNIGEENVVEIVEQDRFEKLEDYKDRWPLLTVRKLILKLRLIITRLCFIIISHWLFEYCSLVVIIANSVVLTLEDPTDTEKSNTGFLATLDTVFLALYTLEMVLKIVGLGFILNKGAYLRDSWNILDFIIVMSAYLQLLMSSGANLSVLRSFRVLRPLRTISGIEGLRVIVSALMKAVTLLVDTVIILVFFFIIFAIAGTQLWSGVLKKRCVSEQDGSIGANDEICGSVLCPYGYFCGKTNENPNFGVTNFDNIFFSLLVVFQSVTLEGWSVIMVYVLKAFNILSLFFFIPLVFIGAFFLLNLTLVVIKSKFTEEHEANKERKKHRKFILTKLTDKDKELLKEAKNAFKRIKIKNKKKREARLERRDSDDSKAESRHRRNLVKIGTDEPILRINREVNASNRIMTAKSNNAQGVKNLRPIHGISGMKKKNMVIGDPITEEISNSELSLMNNGNIFYPSNLSANEANNSTRGYGKERNVLYLKNRNGKLKMEGMYGITRINEGNGNNDLGSNSDLLEEIGVANDDDEIDMGGSEPVLPDDEVLFPLDSSLSETSKTGRNQADPKAKNGGKNNKTKPDFCISESSYEFDEDDSKLSPDKFKNMDKKNTNYFTGTNLSSIDPTERKNGAKNGFMKDKIQSKNSKGDEIDSAKVLLSKNTKFSSRIEGGSAFDKTSVPKNLNKKTENPLSKLKDFNINNILFAHFKSKTPEKGSVKSMSEEDLSEEKKQEKKETEVKEEDLEQMEADQIRIVDKGMKIRVKRTLKPDENRETLHEDILVKRENVDLYNPDEQKKDEDEKILKTTLAPYSLMRELELNEVVLEGKIEKDDDEADKEKEGDKMDSKKPIEASKTFDTANKSQENEDPADDDVNHYLEKFKYFYRSNVIATGTISIVTTLKNTMNVYDFPNPLAESYGAIIIDDEDTSVNEDVQSKGNPKSLIKRNDTLLPGLMRQQTNTSKGFARKARANTRKLLMNKNTMKRRGRDEEEYSEENVLKRLILDIPENSPFYKRVDTQQYQKEMEEDDKLDDVEDLEDEDLSEESDEDANLEDIFLDRDIDFDLEIDRACKSAAKRKQDKTEWSGQDIKIDFDPYYARIAVHQMSDAMVYPYGVIGILSKLRGYVRTFVKSSFFDNLMTVAVAINTCVLAIDHHGISKKDEAVLTTMNTYFTMIFISEMGLKLIGLGPINYLKDRMNYLDGMVVMLSIFELAFLSGGGALSAFRAVRIMRTFRVLRVARLLKSMQSMQTIMDVIARSISSFLYLALLLLLFIFIYALLGMQTFGGKFNFPEGVPRGNFDTFNTAFITVFQVMTMENWQDILYSCMRSDVNNAITVLYLISWIFLGNFMLLNLFLAILLDSFAEEDEADIQKKKSPEELKQDAIEAKNDFMRRTGENLIQDYTDIAMSDNKNNKTKGGGFVKQNRKKAKNDKLMDESFELEDVALKKKKTIVKEKKADYWNVECQRAFYLFHQKNPIRLICYRMTNHYLFENVVLVLIILSSIKLAYDTYIIDAPEDDPAKVASTNVDLFFTFFFLFEAMAKCLSLGFVQDKGSYLRESWNQLDFFIVCASLFDMAFDGVDIPAIRILRLLRTLRPLRFISHNSDMKLIVTALLESVGHIINVVVVVLMVWLMFAILAVNLFGGKLFRCTINTYEISNEEECRLINGKWGSYNHNYNSVPSAMLTLFVVSTLEGWPDLMYQAVDGAGIEQGPEVNASPIAAYFFVIFIFIGSFFFLNFFVGVIFLNYEEAQKAEKESWFMTKKELEWVDIMKMIVNAKPDLETTNVPKSPVLQWIHALVTNTWFDVFIMICIVLNMVQMGLTYEGESPTYTLSLLYINYIFTSIFIVEAILKLIAFGRSYFRSSWNVFDFIVVIGSIIDILLTNLNASQLTFLRVGPQLVRVLRVLRVSRLLRLINKYPGLQALIKTIMFSLPSLLSVFSLLMLIFFIFAILGVFIFHKVKKGDVIDDYVNFNNFGNAMIMCLRVSTGEDWNKVMFDTSNTDSDCIPGETCGTAIAPAYFISFIVICSFVMLNLFILVIIQQFDQYYLADDNILAKFEKDLQYFKNSWTKFTKKTQCIKIKDNKLVEFFKDMEKPLGMTEEDLEDDNEIHKNIVQMDIRADEEGYVYFNELLYKVMKKTYGIKHIRNKKLADHEANTFIKINKIQERMSNYLIREDKKATAVNPFLAIMYHNISFKTWANLAKKRMELEAMKDNIAGSEQSNDDFSDIMLDIEEKSNNSEASFHTFRVSELASSSDFTENSEDESGSPGIETITEHELEGDEKDADDDVHGKRLFGEDEEEDDDEASNEAHSIDETDEEKDEDIYSDDGRRRKSRVSNLKNDKKPTDRSLEKRKSSCPDPDLYNLPNTGNDEMNLNAIEENKNEETFSIDPKDK